MDTPFLTVADTFELSGRGVVVVPGPLLTEYSGARRFPVTLHLPNGDQSDAELTLEFLRRHHAKELYYACLLPGLTKADVPVGTKVYVSEPK